MSSKRKKPYLRCIYCGNDTKPRTDEHVVPKSMGGGSMLRGELVLLEASCPDCQKQIWKYETQVLRTLFLNVRAMHRLPTSKRNRHEIQTTLVKKGVSEIVTLTFDESPDLLVLIAFRAPGLFDGRGRWEIELRGFKVMVVSYLKDNSKRLRDLLVDRQEQMIPVNWTAFAKFLAKIAHGFAVYKLGIDGFTPTLDSIIRNEADDVLYFVGSREAPILTNELHYLKLETVEFEGKEYFVVLIWFFAYFKPKSVVNPLCYEVIVGEPKT